MNTWRNLPGKAFVTLASLDPGLRGRARRAAAGLSPGEAGLFLAMARYDLAHSLAVAARVEEDPLLRRAALLHDTGKLRSELGLYARWLYTALEITSPSLLGKLERRVEADAEGSGVMERMASLPRGWRRGLFVQLHHAEIAGRLLEALGSDDMLVALVGSHQDEPRDASARRLREADDRL
ncbi:MAG: hypothetical protein PHP28_00420 [Actinomycetota bacterium]|nr:hypothetical protein [Actinomycetota bacterium]MDD5667879.1 hypothetical protein [Actinomycetota bacterium]